MNKKPYEAAQMRITLFNNEEVLTASAAREPESVEPDDLPIAPAN